jgi:hypothetical protein
VADKTTPLVLAALGRAAAGAAWPLHGSRSAPGLFPATTAGKQAAQRCRDEGFLDEVPAEPSCLPEAGGNGTATVARKKAAALFAITDKGLTYLLSQVSPRAALEGILAALELRKGELGGVAEMARRALDATESLRANAEKVLTQVPAAGPSSNGHLKALFSSFLGEPARPAAAPTGKSDADLEAHLKDELARWQKADAVEDCPLPHLYRHALARLPGLTIGRYHDALRRLLEAGTIYLHPWTGPLYQLPEPPYALLVGHEVAYYASLR